MPVTVLVTEDDNAVDDAGRFLADRLNLTVISPSRTFVCFSLAAPNGNEPHNFLCSAIRRLVSVSLQLQPSRQGDQTEYWKVASVSGVLHTQCQKERRHRPPSILADSSAANMPA